MIKRLLALLTLFLVVIGFLVWLIGFLTSGNIIITAGIPSNKISLTKVGDQNYFKQGQGKLSLKLHVGQYVAVVQGNSLGVSQLINVQAHKTLTYNLKPLNPTGVEPVIDAPGQYVSANSSQLYYLNNKASLIYAIDAQNNINLVDNSHLFQSIKWASSSLGVGKDSNNHLFSITKGVVSSLNIPTPSVGAFDIAPNGQIYFSYKSNVYKGTSSGTFSKIYTSKDEFSSLSASSNGVAIINSPVADSATTSKPYVNLINSTGKAIRSNISAYSSSVWSPNGNYLATVGGLYYKIFDSSLKEKASIPNNSISNPLWIDNSTLLYSINDQLWTYSLSSGESDLLSNMPLGRNISQLALSDDRSYVYICLSGADGSSPSIKRVGLRAQSVDKTLYKLQSVLPQSLDGYTLNLVNLTSPTIYIQSTNDSPPQAYAQPAQTQLSGEGFNLANIPVRFLSTSY